MKHIITINREFGSGGREVGKRLAELRGIAYYDNEIITKIAERNSLAEDYVQSIIEQKPIRYYPIMIGRSFYTMPDPFFVQSAKIYEEQYQIISELARKSDCVIIGRCADYILREYQTVNIFVYADISSRIRRCQQKSPIEEHLTEQELTRKIISIDKNRAAYYKSFTGQKWGEMRNYHLCLNTSTVTIKNIIAPLSDLISEMQA